jgi:hypothetical protein
MVQIRKQRKRGLNFTRHTLVLPSVRRPLNSSLRIAAVVSSDSFLSVFYIFSVSIFHVSVSTEIYFASFPLLFPAPQLSPILQKDVDSKDLFSRSARFIKRRISAYRGQWKGRILEGGRNEILPNVGSTRLHNQESRICFLAVECCCKMRLLS